VAALLADRALPRGPISCLLDGLFLLEEDFVGQRASVIGIVAQ
jgi:hypothetical protein